MPRRLRNWSLIILGAGLFLAALLLGFLNPLAAAVRGLTRPVADWLSGVGGRSNRLGRNACAELTPEQAQTLKARVAQLAVDQAKLQALEDENRALRAQAKFLFDSGFDSVGARVIGRELRPDRALLLIDRGLNDNLEIGQAVVAGDGVFVGKVSQLKERVATVQLLTDPRSRVAATFSGDSHLAGVVEGRGSGAAVMTYIPADTEVKKDRIIVTSGTESKLAAQLPLGIVNEVLGKSTDPFRSAILESLIPADQVMFVSVLRPTALRPTL